MITIPPITLTGLSPRVLDYADTNCGPAPRILALVPPLLNFAAYDPVTGVADAGDAWDNLQGATFAEGVAATDALAAAVIARLRDAIDP